MWWTKGVYMICSWQHIIRRIRDMIKIVFGCGRGFRGEFMFGKQAVRSAHPLVLFFYSEKSTSGMYRCFSARPPAWLCA